MSGLIGKSKKQLDQYVKEITEAIKPEPDAVGASEPHFSEFFSDRITPWVLISFVDSIGAPVAIDSHEPLSKIVVIQRMIGAIQSMIGRLEDTKKKLEAIQSEKPAATGQLD